MSYKIVKTKHGYGVKNKETGHFKSRDAPKKNAEAQMKLLQGIEQHTINKRIGRTNKTAKR